MKPFKTGVTLSATVVLFYVLCTLVWMALPEPFMNFMNALFTDSISGVSRRASHCPGGLLSTRPLCSRSGSLQPASSSRGYTTA